MADVSWIAVDTGVTHAIRLAGEMERPARELLEGLEEDGDERVHVLRRSLSCADRLAEVGIGEADADAAKEKSERVNEIRSEDGE
jgi:hypothetical protein